MAEMSRVVDTDVMAEDETGDVDEDDNVQATSHNELRLRARLAGPSWERAKEAYEDWNRTVRSFLGEAECCSLCGEVHFHTSASNTLRMKKCNPYGDDLNVPPALKNNPNLPESPGSGSVIAGADGPIVVLRERMRKEKRNGFYVMGAKTIPKRGPQVFSCTFTAEYIEKLLRLDPIVAHSLSTLDTSVAFKKRESGTIQ